MPVDDFPLASTSQKTPSRPRPGHMAAVWGALAEIDFRVHDAATMPADKGGWILPGVIGRRAWVWAPTSWSVVSSM